MHQLFKTITQELRAHVPFTLLGTATALVIMAIAVYAPLQRQIFETFFWTLHPFHVFLSALVTAGMYRLHGSGRAWPTLVIGYCGSIGIGSLSDCIVPYIGEALLGMPNRGVHLGFIEKWWLVNPMAIAGIAIAYWRPTTRFPHAGHVLLSTWASLSHVVMAMGEAIGLFTSVVVALFVFIAVWVPCCTSDIAFPLVFTRRRA